MKTANNSLSNIFILLALAIAIGYIQKPTAKFKRESSSGVHTIPSIHENKKQGQMISTSKNDSSSTQNISQQKTKYENPFFLKSSVPNYFKTKGNKLKP